MCKIGSKTENEGRRRKNKYPYLTVSVYNLTLGAVSILFVSFLFCVVWSIAFNFKTSTNTHCKVLNVLPSFSSAIGRNKLQGYVWRSAVVLHAVPHFLLTRLYHEYNKSVLEGRVHFLVNVLSLLNVVENVALIGLTFVTSEVNYPLHQNFFLVFMVSSEAHMVLTCLLLKATRRKPARDIESRSLRVKCLTLAINVVSFVLAGYFFIRHAQYCEPLVFSMFSFFEYVVVFANMAFHLTACWDFRDTSLTFDICGITISEPTANEKWSYKVLAGS